MSSKIFFLCADLIFNAFAATVPHDRLPNVTPWISTFRRTVLNPSEWKMPAEKGVCFSKTVDYTSCQKATILLVTAYSLAFVYACGRI
jgi:hypothetical protein